MIKSASSLFQWEGSLKYGNTRFKTKLLARTYRTACVKLMVLAIEEWTSYSEDVFERVYEHVREYPKCLNLRYALRKKYNDPSCSLDQCIIASNRLARFIRKLGFDVQVLTLTGPKFGVDQALPKWKRRQQIDWNHTVVQVGNTIYDLTDRQFSQDSPYPLITTLNEVQTKWDHIEDAA